MLFLSSIVRIVFENQIANLPSFAATLTTTAAAMTRWWEEEEGMRMRASRDPPRDTVRVEEMETEVRQWLILFYWLFLGDLCCYCSCFDVCFYNNSLSAGYSPDDAHNSSSMDISRDDEGSGREGEGRNNGEQWWVENSLVRNQILGHNTCETLNIRPSFKEKSFSETSPFIWFSSILHEPICFLIFSCVDHRSIYIISTKFFK